MSKRAMDRLGWWRGTLLGVMVAGAGPVVLAGGPAGAPTAPAAAPAAPAGRQAAADQARADDTITGVSNWQEDFMFYLFAAAAVASALGVVFSGSVVRMAMWLFSTFGVVALLFFLLQAHFLAAVQLIVYVGGILVLIVFGIMLTSSSPWLRYDIRRWELAAGGAVAGLLLAVLVSVLTSVPWSGTPRPDYLPIEQVGQMLFTDYLVPFEVASVLLLVVMIGAAYLAKQEKT